MINVCMFGAHEGQLAASKKLYVTVFGGCELKRPTVARQLIDARLSGQTELSGRFQFFLTIFGAVSIKSPTLAEEYLDLQDALRGGLLKIEEWDRAVSRLTMQPMSRATSLTLFGGFDSDEVPNEEEELDALAPSQHLGQIPAEASRTLMMAVGQRGSQRPAVVRSAITGAVIAAA